MFTQAFKKRTPCKCLAPGLSNHAPRKIDALPLVGDEVDGQNPKNYGPFLSRSDLLSDPHDAAKEAGSKPALQDG